MTETIQLNGLVFEVIRFKDLVFGQCHDLKPRDRTSDSNVDSGFSNLINTTGK